MIQVLKSDITKLKVDCIVNAANRTLLGGGGVDGAIHRAAGPELLDYCRTLGGAQTGEAKITPGFNLNARYVIHTVGPVWHGGHNHEAELLRSCYINSLQLALDNDIRTIAFPSVSTGVYGYPFEEAAKVAVNAILDFVEQKAEAPDVFLVCFSDSDFYSMQQVLDNAQQH
jgi:O-acetyl-ADP-ribose deacetylase (regulator of RNase III)